MDTATKKRQSAGRSGSSSKRRKKTNGVNVDTAPAVDRYANGSNGTSKRSRRDTISVSLNPNLLYIKDGLKESFLNSQPLLLNNGIELIIEPFKCLVLPDFIDGHEFLEELKSELDYDIDYQQMTNGLFRYKQSDDFKNIRYPSISGLRQLFLDQVRPLLSDITGIELFEDIELSASKYEYNDTLLSHNDQLDEHRIAFILYLVSNDWTAKDGGTLDLFTKDEPNFPVRRLSPKWNSCVFFEATPNSYHQIAEIQAQDKTGLIVSGWFRGPKVEVQQPTIFIEQYQEEINGSEVEVPEIPQPEEKVEEEKLNGHGLENGHEKEPEEKEPRLENGHDVSSTEEEEEAEEVKPDDIVSPENGVDDKPEEVKAEPSPIKNKSRLLSYIGITGERCSIM